MQKNKKLSGKIGSLEEAVERSVSINTKETTVPEHLFRLSLLLFFVILRLNVLSSLSRAWHAIAKVVIGLSLVLCMLIMVQSTAQWGVFTVKCIHSAACCMWCYPQRLKGEAEVSCIKEQLQTKRCAAAALRKESMEYEQKVEEYERKTTERYRGVDTSLGSDVGITQGFGQTLSVFFFTLYFMKW